LLHCGTNAGYLYWSAWRALQQIVVEAQLEHPSALFDAEMSDERSCHGVEALSNCRSRQGAEPWQHLQNFALMEWSNSHDDVFL
jgi:hypothetical protein